MYRWFLFKQLNLKIITTNSKIGPKSIIEIRKVFLSIYKLELFIHKDKFFRDNLFRWEDTRV